MKNEMMALECWLAFLIVGAIWNRARNAITTLCSFYFNYRDHYEPPQTPDDDDDDDDDYDDDDEDYVDDDDDDDENDDNLEVEGKETVVIAETQVRQLESCEKDEGCGECEGWILRGICSRLNHRQKSSGFCGNTQSCITWRRRLQLLRIFHPQQWTIFKLYSSSFSPSATLYFSSFFSSLSSFLSSSTSLCSPTLSSSSSPAMELQPSMLSVVEGSYNGGGIRVRVTSKRFETKVGTKSPPSRRTILLFLFWLFLCWICDVPTIHRHIGGVGIGIGAGVWAVDAVH